MAIDDGELFARQEAMDDCPEPCPYVEYDDVSDESSHCALVAGHKLRHQRGERVAG